MAITEETTEERRKRLARERQQRARDKKKGTHEIRITLTESQYAEFVAYMAEQRGPLATFPVRALLTGARFVRNSGAVKKVKGASK